MPDKKLTDAEIVKALECCSNDKNVCNKCPLEYECGYNPFYDVKAKYVLSLINRLQEKIDSLYETVDYRADKITELEDKLKTAKAENERLKNCVKSEDEVRDIAKRTMEPLVKEIIREQIDIAVKLAKAEAYKEFAEEIKAEIHEALENNYKVRGERIAKPIIDMADEFVSYCDGKIDCLRGINDFIDEFLRKKEIKQ